MDEAIAVYRDWGPVNPSPRNLFAGSHQGDLGRKPSSDFAMESFKERPLPEMQKNHGASDDSLGTNGRGEVGNGSSSKNCDLSMDNGSSRGGLVERIAARAGFHAPKLNTARAKFASLGSSAMDISSPYVTIPPGLSPTTLLDSPIFLVNPLTLPSPTTGKLPLGHNTVNVLSSVPEVSYNDVLFDADLFAFRSPLEANNLHLHDRVDEGSSLNQQVPIQLESRNQSRTIDANVCSPSHGTGPDGEEQKLEHSSVSLGLQMEDGYNWRKYGQKQVKGSEYPRGYYKCTHPNCQAKKKIERSQEGQITDIVYKGAHNHPKPPPNRRAVLSSQEQTNVRENQAQSNGADMWSTMTRCEADRVGDRTEGSSYAPQMQRVAWFESTQDQEVDQANHGSGSLENEINDDEFESKRRKLDHPLMDLNPASRTGREPRIVVQTTSDIDVLDDGYRWRKYGQKVVKGNPNPRSYYKCTSAGCNVRKHVERASHDLKSVITTYEGRHNHDVPVARTANNHVSFAPSSIHSHSVSKTSESYRAQDSSLPHLASQTQPPLDAFQHQERRETVGDFCLGAGQLGHEDNAIPGAISMNMVPQVLMDTGYQGVNQTRFLLVPKEDIKIESILEMGTQIPNMASLCQQVIGRILP